MQSEIEVSRANLRLFKAFPQRYLHSMFAAITMKDVYGSRRIRLDRAGSKGLWRWFTNRLGFDGRGKCLLLSSIAVRAMTYVKGLHVRV